VGVVVEIEVEIEVEVEAGIGMWDARSTAPRASDGCGCCGDDLSVSVAPVGFGGEGASAGRIDRGVGLGLIEEIEMCGF